MTKATVKGKPASAKKTGTCALHARIGRRLKFAPNSGPYDVCLTETQRKALFGDLKPDRSIGCGTFACVWPGSRPDRVVKITRDREDVEGLRASKGLERVVRTYSEHLLARAGTDAKTGKSIRIYAIVAERLTPLTEAQQKSIVKPLERARLIMLKRAEKHRGPARTFRAPGWVESPKLVREACKKTPGAGCERFVESFFDGWSKMFQRGILWQDAHPGNIALDSRGRWKAIDLGFSGTKKRSNIPALNGRFRSR